MRTQKIIEGQLTTRAVSLLKRVAIVIQKQPDTYNQFRGGTINALSARGPVCGSPVCIIGWMAHFAYIRRNKASRANMGYYNSASVGLTKPQWRRLFNCDKWPIWFRQEHVPSPKIAAMRIEHFIATNGKE